LIHQKHERERKREAARKAKNAPAAQVPTSAEPIIPGPAQDDLVNAAIAARQESMSGNSSVLGKSDDTGTAFGKSQGSGSAFSKFNPMSVF